MKEKIILVGGGGHCRSCIDVIELEDKYDIVGIVDIPEKKGEKVSGYKIIATEDDLSYVINEYRNCLITIGQLKSPAKRVRLYKSLKEMGAELPIIISPLAHVSKHSCIGEGTIVMHQALVNSNVQIGLNCIINNKALIEHDACIGDHCHIATGSIVNGGVKIGSHTFFGSNAVSREYIEIGSDCIIGCGSKIFKSVPSKSKITDTHM